MTEPQDDPQQVSDVPATGPEFDPAGDLGYDEAHGAGQHEDVPAALLEEARQRRTLSQH
ncbi:hypothetical protein [Actinoplanes aureus]|jgi:hypothetical protein|uniref:Uncharacterized protein n=1 Tax=Actinoplanes aureus TaxID=2792083 RepID=A0A931CHP9_9ACTN|nr:hypothetical protein [Actinoplanes aureus]MBG0567473.1 hypothetical protein [Actinoplanes aureus]